MTHYDRLKRKRLGDILVDEDLVLEDAMVAALQEQQASDRLLSAILIDGRQVGEYDLARAVVEQYQTPFVDLKHYAVHKDLVESFPAELLQAAAMVPLDRFGRQVCFACQEIPSEETVKQLKAYAPGGIYVYIASAVEIRQVLHQYASKNAAAARAGAADPREAAAVQDLARDTTWKELFDSANEAVLQDLSAEGGAPTDD